MASGCSWTLEKRQRWSKYHQLTDSSRCLWRQAFTSFLQELKSRMKSGQKNWNLELVFNAFGIQVATLMWPFMHQHSCMAMPKNTCSKEKRRFDWTMQPRIGNKHAQLHQASVALPILHPLEKQEQDEYCSIAV